MPGTDFDIIEQVDIDLDLSEIMERCFPYLSAAEDAISDLQGVLSEFLEQLPADQRVQVIKDDLRTEVNGLVSWMQDILDCFEELDELDATTIS